MAAGKTTVSLMKPELDLKGMLWISVVDIRFCLAGLHSFSSKTSFSFWRTPFPTLKVYGAYGELASVLSFCDVCLVNGSHCNWLQDGHVTQSRPIRNSPKSSAASVGVYSC